MECRKSSNLKQCSCSYPGCSRKGTCCECLFYHWRMRELPGCLFPSPVESTYDRSLKTFLRVWADEMGMKLVPK